MFYNVEMLTRGGKFAVIWLASSGQHLRDGKILAKYRRDALKVNVLKTVEDLQQYIIPNNDPNCPSKFSLYLAARLCHGTIAVHAFQVKHGVKNFCDQVYNRPRKLKPGHTLDCPKNTTAHNPNLKRCRCQKCVTTLDYEEAEFGELFDNVREETEGLRVAHPDGGKENVSPLQSISEWPEEDEAKFIKDLIEAFQKAGTQVKDVNSITLPENLVFINEQQIGDTICSHPQGSSFLDVGEDPAMLINHLNLGSEFHIGHPRSDPGPRFQRTGEPMEEEHYQETARENNVEMDIDIQHTDPAVTSMSTPKGKRPGVPGEKGPTVPKKSKTIAEEGDNVQIGFPELENFPEQEAPIAEDSTTTNVIVVRSDAAEENADVLISMDPRQARIEMEPVIEEQLSKRRRRQRRVLIFDEQTQLLFAEMADQIQNYNDTLRVLDSFDDVVVSSLYPLSSASTLLTRPCVFGPICATLAGLVTRHFYVPRNQPDYFVENEGILFSPTPPGTGTF